MASAALAPRVRTAVVCERIKPSQIEYDVFDLKGVRYAISARQFPFKPARLWLFLVLSSPRTGRFPGTVQIVHDRTERVIFIADLDPAPEFEEEHAVVTVSVRLRGAFPEAGRYTIRVNFLQPAASDVLKAEVPFDVVAEKE
jgi:hypothetical protein